MGDFGCKYYKIRPNEDRGNDPPTRKKFNRYQEKNAIINHALDEILLQENNKVSAEAKAHEVLNLRLTGMIYTRLKIWVLTTRKKRHNDASVSLKANPRIHMRLKSRMLLLVYMETK